MLILIYLYVYKPNCQVINIVSQTWMRRLIIISKFCLLKNNHFLILCHSSIFHWILCNKNINVVKLIKWIVYSNTKNNLNKTATTWDIHTYIASPHNHQTTTSPPPATLFLAGFAGFRPKLLLSQNFSHTYRRGISGKTMTLLPICSIWMLGLGLCSYFIFLWKE